MIELRPWSKLPGADLGWLRARHHFPVDGRHDPDHMPVRSLYVWNDDEIGAHRGFPLHAHRDVEIVTYVRSGAVTHQDTLGNAYEIRAGDVQVMSAGTGIHHAEVNRGHRPLKLFQIWIAPNRRGGEPSYATRHRPWRDRPNELVVLASGLAQDRPSDALPLHADARLLAGHLQEGRSLSFGIPSGRALYLVAAAGSLRVGGVPVAEGDGVAVSDEATLELEALQDTELVVVELA
jgi:hypothetical protein